MNEVGDDAVCLLSPVDLPFFLLLMNDERAVRRRNGLCFRFPLLAIRRIENESQCLVNRVAVEVLSALTSAERDSPTKTPKGLGIFAAVWLNAGRQGRIYFSATELGMAPDQR
ncbi:MAG TPA: hypothetical protein VGK48_26085 [Terriglobia bacterium]|jgi:hypothetical protein